MNKQLFIRIRSVYGKELIYPECHDSALFCALLKQATLTRDNIELIKQLGYEIIEQKGPEL